MLEDDKNPIRSNLDFLIRKAIQNNRRLYLLNDKLIAKSMDSYKSAIDEYAFGKFAYENGVSVPKIQDIVSPDNTSNGIDEPITCWFIVMDYIKGEDLAKLDGGEKKDAIKQYRREIRKVADLGVFPGDSSFGENAIYSRDRKLYLIDFESWKYGSKEELKRVHDAISTPLPRGYNLEVYDWD